jgi:hypothetical protein
MADTAEVKELLLFTAAVDNAQTHISEAASARGGKMVHEAHRVSNKATVVVLLITRDDSPHLDAKHIIL